MEYPSIAPSIPLAGGTSIPAVGLGVFRSACGTETEQAVTWALEAGYRHIDSAKLWKRRQRGPGHRPQRPAPAGALFDHEIASCRYPGRPRRPGH